MRRFGDRQRFAIEVGDASDGVRMLDLWAGGVWLTCDDNQVYVPAFRRLAAATADDVRSGRIPLRPFPGLPDADTFHRLLADDSGSSEQWRFLLWGEVTDNVSMYAYAQGDDVVMLFGFWRPNHPFPGQLGKVFTGQVPQDEFVASIEDALELLT